MLLLLTGRSGQTIHPTSPTPCSSPAVVCPCGCGDEEVEHRENYVVRKAQTQMVNTHVTYIFTISFGLKHSANLFFVGHRNLSAKYRAGSVKSSNSRIRNEMTAKRRWKKRMTRNSFALEPKVAPIRPLQVLETPGRLSMSSRPTDLANAVTRAT